MKWFIKKGAAVEENKPHVIDFHHLHLCSEGKPKSVTLQVWCDSETPTAPIHRDKNVRNLVTLEADLTHLSKSDLTSIITVLADKKKYYVTSGSIEATFYSASTKYVLLCQGKRYDTVTAEYV